MTARFLVSLAPFLCALPVVADGPPPARPNILLLLSDDQRPDTIAALGNPSIDTPHLDRLVNSGTAFLRATCANPICTPSRAEILTGTTGFRSGVFDFGRKFEPHVPRWAATLRDAGYRTGYVGKWHNSGRPPDHGYDETPGLFTGGGGRWAVASYDWNGREATGYRGWVFRTKDGGIDRTRGVGLEPNISEHFADAAIEFLNADSDRPFFLHVNFTAPHDPLLMPFGYEDRYAPAEMPVPKNFLPRHPFDHGNFDGRDERLFERPRTEQMVRDELAVYYAVITHMDAQIGRILDALERSGRLKNTIVVFAGDHGLAIGSHGLRGKQSMYEHTIGVPLIISGPGVPRGKRTDAQCYLRDLFPTTCDLAGVEFPESVEGRSLKPVLTGETTEIYPFVVGYFRNVQRMIRTDEWKLIWYPHLDRYQLFHLKTDPHELHDLSRDAAHAATVADLRVKLEDWLRQHDDPLLRASE
ncbi:MAG: sulfatase-like hydrolase/transferase [Planctomycetaceae bacterium]